MLKVFGLLLLITIAAADDHDHGEGCGCVASEQGWKIDCATATTTVSAALSYLQSNNCNQGTTCSTNAECQKQYYLLNAHHDYCDHDDLPQNAEEEIHAFEAFCQQCSVQRIFKPELPVCEQPNCTDSARALAALAALQSNNCATTCGAGVCADNFRVIRAYHDRCEHDDVPEDVERELHDFEEACEQQSCNVATAAFDPNVCVDDDVVTAPPTTTVAATSSASGTSSGTTSAASLSDRLSSGDIAAISLGVLLIVALTVILVLVVLGFGRGRGKSSDATPLTDHEADMASPDL